MKDLFKKMKSRIKGLHKARFINPHVHWIIFVKLFLMMALILIIFSFYLLFKIKNDEVFQVIPDSSIAPPSLIKEELLEKINESFLKKEIMSKELESGRIFFPDPS